MADIQQIQTGQLLVSGAGGNVLDTYTQPIHGRVLKVVYQSGTVLVSGMFIIETSGIVTEKILTVSGATDFPASAVYYPYVYGVNNVNVTGSPQVFFNRQVNGPLKISASGLGSPANIGNLSIYYQE